MKRSYPTNYSGSRVKVQSGSRTPAVFYTCSAPDYAKLMTVFLNQGTYEQTEILSQESVALMTEEHFGNHAYILHFPSYTFHSEKILFHTGDFNGIRTGVYISCGSEAGFVILRSGEYDALFALYDLIQITLDFGRELK